MKQIKVIFFDIDDTLYSTNDFAKAARKNAIQGMIDVGLNISFEEGYREYLETIEEFGTNFGNHFEKLLLRLPRECYSNVNPVIVIAAGVVAYHKTKSRGFLPYDDVVHLLDTLNSRGTRLGVITEGLKVKQAEKLVRLELLNYFDPLSIFITDQIGIGKQNPKLYRRACEVLSVDPQNCLHVGDNPLKDIDPANHAGLTTVLVKRGSKYGTLKGKTLPNYSVNDMAELLMLLDETFCF